MDDQPCTPSALLTSRLSHVAVVSATNAEALRLTQLLAGMEMDVLRIELQMRSSPGATQLVQELHEVQEKAEAAQAARAECEERIAAAEREIDEIDRRLAASGRER